MIGNASPKHHGHPAGALLVSELAHAGTPVVNAHQASSKHDFVIVSQHDFSFITEKLHETNFQEMSMLISAGKNVFVTRDKVILLDTTRRL